MPRTQRAVISKSNIFGHHLEINRKMNRIALILSAPVFVSSFEFRSIEIRQIGALGHTKSTIRCEYVKHKRSTETIESGTSKSTSSVFKITDITIDLCLCILDDVNKR